MCPACIATSAWLVAGAATAVTGLGAAALAKLRKRAEPEDFQLRMQPDELELRGEEA
jgi:hypothetical protein